MLRLAVDGTSAREIATIPDVARFAGGAQLAAGEAEGCMTSRERLTLSGRLEAESFLPWICRYAAKLDLTLQVHRVDAHRIEIDVEGAPELIDMMDVGCSLGPIDVWVEDIARHPL